MVDGADVREVLGLVKEGVQLVLVSPHSVTTRSVHASYGHDNISTVFQAPDITSSPEKDKWMSSPSIFNF